MKYLKLYEIFEKFSFNDWMEKYGKDYLIRKGSKKLHLSSWPKLTNLNGIENLTNLQLLYCDNNNLSNLKGIENLTGLTVLQCNDNNLTNLKEIKNLINLMELFCWNNKLNNMEEVKNLINLKYVNCQNNKLTNLECIENCINIRNLKCEQNSLEYPICLIIDEELDHDNCKIYYDEKQTKYFQSYTCQKRFLKKFPEKIEFIKPFGFNKKIKEEFADIIEGSEFGFFNLR